MAKKFNANWRPYNSVRFICTCGRKHTFPRAPAGGRKASEEYKLPDGTRKVVTTNTKEVHCVCGFVTYKERTNFRGR